MIVLLEGAEKAGKTTLAKKLCDEHNSNLGQTKMIYRHWGPFDPDDRVISQQLQLDCMDREHHYIWDRGWASETVYAKLLKRNRRGVDAWLMEWLHGRSTCLKYIVTADTDYVQTLRTADDLPVDPFYEQAEFLLSYPTYRELENDYTELGLRYNVERVLEDMIAVACKPKSIFSAVRLPLPVYFVASKTNMSRGDKWLPFSFTSTTSFMQQLGNLALKFQYLYAHEADPTALRNAEYIVTLGGEAAKWVQYYVGNTSAQVFNTSMLKPSIRQRAQINQILNTIKRTYEQR